MNVVSLCDGVTSSQVLIPVLLLSITVDVSSTWHICRKHFAISCTRFGNDDDECEAAIACGVENIQIVNFSLINPLPQLGTDVQQFFLHSCDVCSF